jgi:hypothetical protein
VPFIKLFSSSSVATTVLFSYYCNPFIMLCSLHDYTHDHTVVIETPQNPSHLYKTGKSAAFADYLVICICLATEVPRQ